MKHSGGWPLRTPSDWGLDKLDSPSAPGAKQTDRQADETLSGSDTDFSNFIEFICCVIAERENSQFNFI